MIKEFQGEYRWLSNFEWVNIKLDGIIYPSVEHAYQSAKSDLGIWKKRCASQYYKPGFIKQLSRSIKVVPNWSIIKDDIMVECVTQKFNKEPFRTKLINTDTLYIQEGNLHKDTYWGVNLRTGKGQNKLGKLIMSIRDSLKNDGTYIL